MSQDIPSAREDLAFMRRVVEGGGEGKGQAALGWSYFWCGLLYGFQTLVQWAADAGVIVFEGPAMLAFVIGISVVFVLATVVISRRYGPFAGGGSVGRAMAATFGVIGLSNVVLVAIFGIVASRRGEGEIFLIYPVIVFAMQGAAWVIAALIRKRGWMAAVGLGWYLSALGMALTLGTEPFVLIAGLSMLVLMVLPGWTLVRLSRRPG